MATKRRILFTLLLGATVMATRTPAQPDNSQVFRCPSFSVSYPLGLAIQASNENSVTFRSVGSNFFTIDISFLDQVPPGEQALLSGVEAMIRQAAAQEGASVSIEGPAPAAHSNWIGKTIYAELRRDRQGRVIVATVIPNGESAYLMRLMTPSTYLAEAEAVGLQVAKALVVASSPPVGNPDLGQPSAASQLVGTWIYSDAGGSLEYRFFANGTFGYEGDMYASGYSHISIKSSGTYQVSGASVTVMPDSVRANGSPGTIIRSSGRYDFQSDRLILRQEGSQSVTVFTRAR